MRVLFCTTGGLGHLLPLRPLALALRSRGHEVAWVTAPDACPVLQGDGFDLFAAGPTFEASRRQFRAAHADAARFTGEQLSAYTFPRLFGGVLGPAMLEGVAQAARHWRPDLVVGEPAALAVPLVCQQLGLHHVTQGYGLRPPREYVEDAMRSFGPHWRARGLEAPDDGGLYRHLCLDIAPASLQPSACASSERRVPLQRLPTCAHGAARAACRAAGGASEAAARKAEDLPDLRHRLQPQPGADRRGSGRGPARWNRGGHGQAQMPTCEALPGLARTCTSIGSWTRLPCCRTATWWCRTAVPEPCSGRPPTGCRSLILPQAADHFRNARALVPAAPVARRAEGSDRGGRDLIAVGLLKDALAPSRSQRSRPGDGRHAGCASGSQHAGALAGQPLKVR